MKLKRFAALAVALLVAGGITACSSQKEEAKATENDKTIVIGATANPHAEILNMAVKPLLEKEGYKLDVKVFNDYVLPNTGLHEGSLDANFFQHIPYLEETIKEKKYDNLTWTVKVHIEPMGVFSDKVKKLDELKEGAVIAIPNDPTNGARALKLLEKGGLIKLEDKELVNKNDITENSKKLEIKEMNAEQLPTVLKDVDAAVINANYALQAKLNPVKDAIYIESKDSPYANVVAVRKDEKDSPKIKALDKAINSPEVKKFIEETYKGAIIPAF